MTLLQCCPRGVTVAALDTKTLIVSLHWEKGYGADPSSACWHEQLGLTACICLGIHPTSSLKICDDMETALQHSAVVGQPGAVLWYTKSGLLSCTGNLQCALSHLLEILLLKPLQCYTPAKPRTTAVLFKKSTPAPSEATGKFYILMECFCLELVKSKGDCFKQPENRC